jgi:adenylosuccinate synthase
LHTQHYQQCTSSDCTATDFLAMAGIAAWDADDVTVWVCLRTYPIRVAGNSGHMKDETTWEDLGAQTSGYIQEERTTVTQMVRRVGGWDLELAQKAVQANGIRAVQVALTFFDYWYPEVAGMTDYARLTDEQRAYIAELSDKIGVRIGLVGTGPNTVIEIP